MSAHRGKALHCHGPGLPLRVETMELAAGPGESVVRMRVAAVTQLDRTMRTAKPAREPRPPFVPGSEGGGVVIASAVHPVGAPVLIRGGGVGVSRPGTWGTLAVVPDEAVHPLPAGLDLARAAGLLTPALTAHTAVRRVAQVRPGEGVVVTGVTGLVGRLCAAIARAAGATKVTGLIRGGEAVDQVAGLVDQLVLVDELGQPGRELPWCNAVIDTVGGPITSGVMGHITPGGRLVALGYTAGEFATVDLRQLIGRDLRILPVNMQRTTVDAATVGQALADIAAADIRPDLQVVAAEDVGDALDLLGRRATDRRVLLDVSGIA